MAVLIGLMLSYAAFRGPRDAAARWLADRAERRRAAKGPRTSDIEDDADVEDRAVDAAANTDERNPDDQP